MRTYLSQLMFPITTPIRIFHEPGHFWDLLSYYSIVLLVGPMNIGNFLGGISPG